MATCLEICAGAGGQALGLEQAGFEPLALVEIEGVACETLRLNRPSWNVIEGDVRSFDGKPFHGVDLLAGGVPCPPFSVAGKQLGSEDERDLFPDALRLVEEANPRAVMLENVRGFLSSSFKEYRNQLRSRFEDLGYEVEWRLLNASDFGVPQLRPRVVIVAFRDGLLREFEWPRQGVQEPASVGIVLRDMMAANGWQGADAWMRRAASIAPTVVGGSKKHGGPDLGPTRAKQAWAELGVNGKSIANEAPGVDFAGDPRLTVQMVAKLQGFPDNWVFAGKKTPAYRQVGNAFPPPVAAAVANSIQSVLSRSKRYQVAK